MMFSLVGKVNGAVVIFGQGNTFRTAAAAGAWNAKQMDVRATKVVTSLPKSAVWYHQLKKEVAQ